MVKGKGLIKNSKGKIVGVVNYEIIGEKSNLYPYGNTFKKFKISWVKL